MTSPPVNDRTVDHAAVVGVALAGVLSVAFEAEAWKPISLMIGLILLALLCGFYRFPATSPYPLLELTGLSAGLVLPFLMLWGWPMQLILAEIPPTRTQCEVEAFVAEASRARTLGLTDPSRPSLDWTRILESGSTPTTLTTDADRTWARNPLLVADLHRTGEHARDLCIADKATGAAAVAALITAPAAVGTAVAIKRTPVRPRAGRAGALKAAGGSPGAARRWRRHRRGERMRQ